MRLLKGIGRWIWRFMVIFSFIVNLVLVVVLLALGAFIFDIKNNIAQPLVGGLHTTAVGLKQATIDWTIPVRDNIPVNLDIPLQTDTIVRLTAPVPLQVNATIDLPGINAYGVAASVNLQLPAGLELPVALDLNVPVRERLDVALDVRAVIPLAQTQLADPIENLSLLFEPLAIGLHNLPRDFNQLFLLIGKLRMGEPINLLATDGTGGINPEPYVAWPGYSQTAGLNYALINLPVPLQNLPIQTGIVPPGGVPLLDSLLPARAGLYANDQTPLANNAQAVGNMDAKGIPPVTYNGQMFNQYTVMRAVDIIGSGLTPPPDPVAQPPADGSPPAVGGPLPAPTSSGDFGIIQPTPTPGP
jgi:hypothetical protein